MINLASETAIKHIESVNIKLDKLNKELCEHDIYKIQGQTLRTGARWLELSERNSKYFFSLEKFRSKSKTMNTVRNEKNQIITGKDQILQEQFKFYQQLYTKDPAVKVRTEK